jgi:hypothetical protein
MAAVERSFIATAEDYAARMVVRRCSRSKFFWEKAFCCSQYCSLLACLYCWEGLREFVVDGVNGAKTSAASVVQLRRELLMEQITVEPKMLNAEDGCAWWRRRVNSFAILLLEGDSCPVFCVFIFFVWLFLSFFFFGWELEGRGVLWCVIFALTNFLLHLNFCPPKFCV